MVPRARPGALALALLCSLGPSLAGERQHTVRAGESASAIARDYYGDVKLGELLLFYNGRTGTTLQVGEHLRIPYCERHVVGRGDTWSGLAHRYLGDGSLHPVLALLNDRDPGSSLHPGQPISIPVLLRHTLQRGESLGRLAERYTSRSEILQELNGVENPRRLSVGQELRIPVLSFWLLEQPPQPEPRGKTGASADPPAAEPEIRSQEFLGTLEAAEEAILEGEFRKARRDLEALAPEVKERGSEEEQNELARLLAIVYVAFDLPERACEAYVAAAGIEMDPDHVSPKVLDTLAGCSGAPPPVTLPGT